MAAYEDREELEKLKAWWKNYGGSVIFGIALGVAILVGFRYWSQHTEQQRHTAAALYDRMFREFHSRMAVDARRTAESLMNDYAATPYAGMAGLLLARLDYEDSDAIRARERLQWVLKHASDTAVKHAARLRLARLHLDGGDRDAALALLDIRERAGFEAEYEELKGDIFVALGQREAARKAYREALRQLPVQSNYAPVLNMKLDDLGPEPGP